MNTQAERDHAWRAAATLRRRRRMVADWRQCRSPGLESVIASGAWVHPRSRPGPFSPAGVLLFKPGMTVGPETLAEVAVRLAECGYAARRARLIHGEEVRRRGLAASHYRPNVKLARAGRLGPAERAAFLALYDQPEFARAYGTRPSDTEIVPAYELIERVGVPASAMAEWSQGSALRHGLNSGRIDGANNIGDCLYVNVFRDPRYLEGRPVAVLNPHIPGMIEQMEDPAGTLVAVLVHGVSARRIDWRRMRAEFCGVTDPARALPGSLRGDALAGLLSLRGTDGEAVTRTNNGLHLSNGAVEALHDCRTWFDVQPEDTVAGQLLARAGLDVRELLDSSFVCLAGKRRAVCSLTDGMTAEEAASLLQSASHRR